MNAKALDENSIAALVIDSAIRVHRELGAGLFESACEGALAYELADRGLSVERQKSVYVVYRGSQLEEGFRADLVINERVVVEIKSVKHFDDVHYKQLLTYLKLMNCKLGHSIEPDVPNMKNGIRRLVNVL